uniref:Uncharacterized protein n=1 Tax=Meloidogyne enterolobii TaxID=390850 RepID=A0A6V7WJY1_MELEN|nr:unnamed protein product [Meloidogyne enterolobii]
MTRQHKEIRLACAFLANLYFFNKSFFLCQISLMKLKALDLIAYIVNKDINLDHIVFIQIISVLLLSNTNSKTSHQ